MNGFEKINTFNRHFQIPIHSNILGRLLNKKKRVLFFSFFQENKNENNKKRTCNGDKIRTESRNRGNDEKVNFLSEQREIFACIVIGRN
jgi:hypothetical protein